MTRLDVYLVEEGFFDSRQRAQDAVKAGLVSIGGRTADKPSRPVGPDSAVAVRDDPVGYVGRGGLKLEKALDGVEREGAPLFLPFLHGEQSPGWDDTRLGMYCDLSGDHDIYSMYYALLEGVLFNLYHCYTYLSELMEEPKEIRLSGGIVNSAYWTRMAADIFGIPIAVSAVEHGSMMGAIAIAKKITGRIAGIADYDSGAGRVIEPDEQTRDLLGKRYARYRQYYDRTAKEESQ